MVIKLFKKAPQFFFAAWAVVSFLVLVESSHCVVKHKFDCLILRPKILSFMQLIAVQFRQTGNFPFESF